MPSYEINFSLIEYFPALLRQIYASFPLSYFYSNPGGIFNHDFKKIIDKVLISDIITITLFLVIVSYVLSKKGFLSSKTLHSAGTSPKKHLSKKTKNRLIAEQISVNSVKDSNRRHIFMVGLMLLTLPNMLIALSPTYQYLIYWGIAHLPVYICYFGSFLILSVAIDKIMAKSGNHIKQFVVIVLIACISTGYAINFQNNRQIIETQNQTYWYKRNFLEISQKETSFLSTLKSDSLLLYSVEDNLSLDLQPFLYSLTGARIENVDTRRLIPWYKKFREGGIVEDLKIENPDYWAKFGSKESELFSKYNKIFIVKYWSDSYLQGYVSIADISDLVLDIDDKATFIKTTGAQIFVLKSGKGPLKIEYETFSCPKLSSECLIQANGVTSLSTEDFSTSGRFIKFWLTPDAISKIDSAWLDFKSIKIGGMDGEINEP